MIPLRHVPARAGAGGIGDVPTAPRGTSANVGTHRRTWARSRGRIAARTRLGRGCGRSGRLRRPRAKTQGTRMMGVAPPARAAPPAEVRELGAAGWAVPRRCEARAEGHRRGRGQRLEGVSAHAPPHWRKPPTKRETRPSAHSRRAPVSVLPRRLWATPPRSRRRTLRRVARAAQHLRVGDVERRTASGERDDVIDGQVAGSVGGALVARAPVAVLATPGAQHAGAEPLPGPRAVQGVVPAAVGLAGVLGAAATRAAGDDTTDRAQLHPQIVGGLAGAVYSPAVLGVRGQERPATGVRSVWQGVGTQW